MEQSSNINNADTAKQEDISRYKLHSQKRHFLLLELVFWLLIVSFFVFKLTQAVIEQKSYEPAQSSFDHQTIAYLEGLKNRYILIITFVIVTPILFKLTFGEYPFQYIRHRAKGRQQQPGAANDPQTTSLPSSESSEEVSFLEPPSPSEKDSSNTSIKESVLFQKLVQLTKRKRNEIETVDAYLDQAKDLSKKLYNRSSAYLFVGCLIAFAGVTFFYFQTDPLLKSISESKEKIDFSKKLFEYIPRFGTLIFVELIAFFFLRQYRVNMEEFRYYEAIKRQREDQLAVLIINREYLQNGKPELIEPLIKNCLFGTNPNKLIVNESTQFLEAKKSMNSDFDLLDKIAEIIKASKK